MSQNNYQRQLLIVPIIHTKEDMGSLGSRLRPKDGYDAVAAKLWQEISQKLKRYTSDIKTAKVYQDGLPDADEKLVAKIVNEVKSPNYELLRYLQAKGAKILGTEDPQVLKQEYNYLSKITQAQDEETKNKLRKAYKSQVVHLLTQRDSYIAKRIDQTLKTGELGILFLGLAHAIKDKLAKDIQVEVL